MNKRIIDLKWAFVFFVKVTGFIPIMLFLRPKYYYPSKETKKEFKRTSCIIASNHSSLQDPFYLVSVMYFKRLSIVATKELFEGFKGLIFRGFRAIRIDKDAASLSTFKQVNNVIKDGHSVAVFPEGTTVHDKDEVINFKTGVILMSKLSKAPIYPLYLVKRKNIFQRYKIIIGERFDLDKLNLEGTVKEKQEKAAELLHAKELELQQKAEKLIK